MERIKGTKIDEEIDRLIREKKWLKLQIVSKDYERVSVVNQSDSIDGEDHFQVDTPEDLLKILAESTQNIEIIFEFRGSDNIRYKFNTKRWRLLGSDLWISKPDSIDRIQKRNNFRVSAPIDSHLILKQDLSRLTMRLENISIGGAFASTRLNDIHHSNSIQLDVGQQIVGFELAFPFDIMEGPIHILLSQIIRVEKGYRKSRTGYAVHFIEIDNRQKSLLTRVVYHLQRRFLQMRLKE